MKLITWKQEEEQKENQIKKLMFVMLNPILGMSKEEARIRAEEIFAVDAVIIGS